MEPLDDREIEDGLTDLPGWEYDGEAISRSYEWSSFREAIEFVNDLADLAEDENHHPDLEIYYDEVVVSFRTHSEDAVTDRDLEMAREVEDLVAEFEEDLDDGDDDEDEDDLDDLELDEVDVEELDDVDVGSDPDDELDLGGVGHPDEGGSELDDIEVDPDIGAVVEDDGGTRD